MDYEIKTLLDSTKNLPTLKRITQLTNLISIQREQFLSMLNEETTRYATRLLKRQITDWKLVDDETLDSIADRFQLVGFESGLAYSLIFIYNHTPSEAYRLK